VDLQLDDEAQLLEHLKPAQLFRSRVLAKKVRRYQRG
jgi:hypothetical protein